MSESGESYNTSTTYLFQTLEPLRLSKAPGIFLPLFSGDSVRRAFSEIQ